MADRTFESLPVKRLEQVIQSVEFKCSERIDVIRCDENDIRNPVSAQRFQNFKSIHFRHLHIQEQKIRRSLLNHLKRRLAVTGLSNNFYLLIIAEHPPDPPASDRFVINDQGFNSL